MIFNPTGLEKTSTFRCSCMFFFSRFSTYTQLKEPLLTLACQGRKPNPQNQKNIHSGGPIVNFGPLVFWYVCKQTRCRHTSKKILVKLVLFKKLFPEMLTQTLPQMLEKTSPAKKKQIVSLAGMFFTGPKQYTKQLSQLRFFL